MMGGLLLVPDDEDLLEFSHGVPKYFPFFHTDEESTKKPKHGLTMLEKPQSLGRTGD